MAKKIAEMAMHAGGGKINWFPGHMVVATRVIRERLKIADMVIEVRDARIPVSSANDDLQDALRNKRRIIVMNKKDLGNSNVMKKWSNYFVSEKTSCCSTNAHNKNSVKEVLNEVEKHLRELVTKRPTLLVMVIGIPNVGKSCLINAIYQISRERFPVQKKPKRATVGPLPGVTQDIAGFKIAEKPSIYVLDTPGVLIPRIPDNETGFKLALTGAIKDSVVGEDRLAQYLLAWLNLQSIPLRWKHLDSITCETSLEELKKSNHGCSPSKSKKSVNEVAETVQPKNETEEARKALHKTFSDFEGNLDDENDLEHLIDDQFSALQRVFKIPPNTGEAGRIKVSKKLLQMYRAGKLGQYVLDTLPEQKR